MTREATGYFVKDSPTHAESKIVKIAKHKLPFSPVTEDERYMLQTGRVSVVLPYYVYPLRGSKEPFLKRLQVVLVQRSESVPGALKYSALGGNCLNGEASENSVMRETAEETNGLLSFYGDRPVKHKESGGVKLFSSQLMRLNVPYISPYINAKHPGIVDLYFLKLTDDQFSRLRQITEQFKYEDFAKRFEKRNHKHEIKKFVVTSFEKAMQLPYYAIQSYRDMRLLAKIAAYHEGYRTPEGRVIRNTGIHKVSPVLSNFKRSDFEIEGTGGKMADVEFQLSAIRSLYQPATSK